jgi:hypothetical protein
MLQYAVRPNEVAILVPPSGLLDLLSDDDVKSVDQIGGAATLLSGQLASLYGKPIIVSNEIPDMSTAGTVETSANVDKCAIMVNRTRWRIGVKRGMEIRQIDAVGDDAIALVGFMRTCVNHVPGTDPHTVVIHGIN